MGLLAVLLLFILGLLVAVLVVGGWVIVKVVSLLVSLVVGIGGGALPILMIALGAWLVWRAVHDNRQSARERRTTRGAAGPQADGSSGQQSEAEAHRNGRRRRRGEPTPSAAPAAYQPPAHQPPARRELPIDVQIKAEQIQRKADLLLAYADRFPPFSQSLHIVRQTATDYLPRTIQAYLALPGTTDPLVPTTGRTALTELREQLQLLDNKLDDITLDLQQQDLDRMSANRRFLEERFGDERGGPADHDGAPPDGQTARSSVRRKGGPDLRAVS